MDFAKIFVHNRDGELYKTFNLGSVEFAHEIAQDISNAKQYKACLVHFSRNGKSDSFWI